ncbi:MULTISPECIES: hypothetical protein [Paenibacillus]|uniref:Transporter n=1 Tax=Paenibacillus residui TaxID=629724 RepID=A0ABW3D8C9_9BACL|nr:MULTISPECIES: hypothetical protein [Paenibacillaceae]
MKENKEQHMRKPAEGGRYTGADQALQDIEFIKQLIARNRKKLDHSPPYLYIWGAYMMIGFVGMHFDHSVWPNWYWLSGAIVGSILSAAVGMRQSRSSNEQEGGAYAWMFWLPFAVMMLSGFFMLASGIVRVEYASFFWVILVGISYVSLASLAGKGPAVVGCWFILLSILTWLFFREYQFIILGLLGGGSNIMAGIYLQWRSKRHGG